MSELMTKGEFAQLIGVSAGRVSQMISAGQIDADAIVGDGQRAKIRADLARDQLRRRRDVGQSLGNGLATRLDGEQRSSAPSYGPAPQAPNSRRDLFDDAIRAEKLRSLRAANRRATEQELERAGVYVRADVTAAAMNRLAAGMITAVEGGMGEMAQALAARFNLPARDVLHELRVAFREVRAKAAATARSQAVDLPALIDHEVADAITPASGET